VPTPHGRLRHQSFRRRPGVASHPLNAARVTEWSGAVAFAYRGTLSRCRTGKPRDKSPYPSDDVFSHISWRTPTTRCAAPWSSPWLRCVS